MLRGVIFDMDGVLADSHPAHERAWKALLLSMGRVVSEEDLGFIRQGQKRQDILKYFLGELPEDEVRELGKKKDLLFQRGEAGISTIAGVRELLSELNRAAVPTAVASCGTRARVRRLLDILQLNNCFDTILTGDDVVLGKPDPSIFVKASAQLRLNPTDLLVFEDSVSGVLAANAAKMKSVGIAGPQQAKSLIEGGALHALPHFVGVSVSMLEQLFH
jgi:HAD superfamily hydrolase (TIGR01509 family)